MPALPTCYSPHSTAAGVSSNASKSSIDKELEREIASTVFTDKAMIKPWLQHKLLSQGITIVIERSDDCKIVFKCKQPPVRTALAVGVTEPRLINANGASASASMNAGKHNMCNNCNKDQTAVNSAFPAAKRSRRKKSLCPFRIRANYSIRLSHWSLVIVNNTHNHSLSIPSTDTAPTTADSSKIGSTLKKDHVEISSRSLPLPLPLRSKSASSSSSSLNSYVHSTSHSPTSIQSILNADLPLPSLPGINSGARSVSGLGLNLKTGSNATIPTPSPTPYISSTNMATSLSAGLVLPRGVGNGDGHNYGDGQVLTTQVRRIEDSLKNIQSTDLPHNSKEQILNRVLNVLDDSILQPKLASPLLPYPQQQQQQQQQQLYYSTLPRPAMLPQPQSHHQLHQQQQQQAQPTHSIRRLPALHSIAGLHAAEYMPIPMIMSVPMSGSATMPANIGLPVPHMFEPNTMHDNSIDTGSGSTGSSDKNVTLPSLDRLEYNIKIK